MAIKRLTKVTLIEELQRIAAQDTGRRKFIDREADHKEADAVLLAYINDPAVTEAYESIVKWYA